MWMQFCSKRRYLLLGAERVEDVCRLFVALPVDESRADVKGFDVTALKATDPQVYEKAQQLSFPCVVQVISVEIDDGRGTMCQHIEDLELIAPLDLQRETHDDKPIDD